MKVTADGATYEFDPERLLNVELMAIEKVTDLTAMEWEAALNRGSMTAATALIWILRKRNGEANLAFDDVVFVASTADIDSADDVGKDSPDGTAPTSETSSTTTSSPSPDSSESSPGNSNGLSVATISS